MGLQDEVLCTILKNTEQLLANNESQNNVDMDALKKRINALERKMSEIESGLIDFARRVGSLTAKVKMVEDSIELLRKTR